MIVSVLFTFYHNRLDTASNPLIHNADNTTDSAINHQNQSNSNSNSMVNLVQLFWFSTLTNFTKLFLESCQILLFLLASALTSFHSYKVDQRTNVEVIKSIIEILGDSIFPSYYFDGNTTKPDSGWNILFKHKLIIYLKISQRENEIILYGLKRHIDVFLLFVKEEKPKRTLTFIPTPVDLDLYYSYSIYKPEHKRTYEYPPLKFATSQQLKIINDTIFLFENMKNLYKKTSILPQITIMITGYPGSGKTSIGALVASRLSNSHMIYINPIKDKDCMGKILDYHSTSLSKPLIVMIDEIDCIIKHINNPIPLNNSDNDQNSISNESFNRLLDDFRIYAGIIVVMTSNETQEFFKKEENMCYTRNGRVDLKYDMKVMGQTEIIDIVRQTASAYNYSDEDVKLFEEYIETIPKTKSYTIADISTALKIHNALPMKHLIEVLKNDEI